MARRNMVSPDGGVTDESYAVFDGTSGYVLKEGTAPGGGTVTNSGTLNDHEVILGDGAAVVRSLGDVGTSGQVLTSNGAAADPTWEDGGSGTGNVNAAGTLTDHAIVLGDGSTDVTVVGSLGTTTKVLHGAAAGDPTWGTVVEADITLADVTTNNVTSSTHGFTPKSPGDATKFLNGAATPTFAAVKDSDLALTDITTNNVTTSAHGFAPKGDGDTSKFLNANGAYSTPGGSTPKACLVYKTTQNSTSGSTLTCSFDTEYWDNDSMHESVTNPTRITFNTTGSYTVKGYVQFASNNSGYRYIDVRLNGTTVIMTDTRPAVTTDVGGGTVCFDYPFTATNYIELRAFQSSGSTLAVVARFAATQIPGV